MRVAKDIIAEYISDEADYRIYLRNFTTKQGKLISTAKDAEAELKLYKCITNFEEPIRKTGRTPYSCRKPWRKKKRYCS